MAIDSKHSIADCDPIGSKIEHAALFNALYFLKVEELKKIGTLLDLSVNEPKGQIIEALKYFVVTGQKLKKTDIPPISKAEKDQSYPLAPTTLMLKGSYKNDAKTRAFFKHLIGNHFHFTAFGIDWLNARWQGGNPPTYQEFVNMWQEEMKKRSNQKPEPKKEWAYINFVQQYVIKYPNASKTEIAEAWHKKRIEKLNFVHEFFGLTAIMNNHMAV